MADPLGLLCLSLLPLFSPGNFGHNQGLATADSAERRTGTYLRAMFLVGARQNVSLQVNQAGEQSKVWHHRGGEVSFLLEAPVSKALALNTGITIATADVYLRARPLVSRNYKMSFMSFSVPLHLKATFPVLTSRLLLSPWAGVSLLYADMPSPSLFLEEIWPNARVQLKAPNSPVKLNYDLGISVEYTDRNDIFRYGIGCGYTGSFNRREVASLELTYRDVAEPVLVSESRLESVSFQLSISRRLNGKLVKEKE